MRKLNSRSLHRYLSIFVGIQLVLWATSGLIFCWLPIDQVRGDHLVKGAAPVDWGQFRLYDLRELLSDVGSSPSAMGSIVRAELKGLRGQPVYELEFRGSTHQPQYKIYDALNGEPISPLTRDAAEKIALEDFAQAVTVKSATLIDAIDSSHSEYRGKELPVWRVELEHASGTVIYVSANRGLITARRNHQWRLFDFFWMLHTMDYQGRDNFNNWLLFLTTLAGLTSMASGYWLWWKSSQLRSRWRRRNA